MEIIKSALHYLEMGISIVPMVTFLDKQGDVKKKPLIACRPEKFSSFKKLFRGFLA